MRQNIPIGQILLGKGYISEKQLQRALELQKKSPGKRLGDVLVELSYVSERTVLECLSERVGSPFIDVRNYAVNEKAAALVNKVYAQKNHVLAIDFQNNALLVATYDPLAFYVFDELQSITGYEIKTVLAVKNDIDFMIKKCYSEDTVNRAVEDVNREYSSELQIDESITLMGERIEGTPVVKLVNTLITQAYLNNASDIHIEPFEKSLIIRYRINGDLVQHSAMSMAAHNSILTRLKLLSGMNIAEKRIPQDGKFRFPGGEFEVDIRVSTMPTVYGEKAVLRLLGGTNQLDLLDLSKIGMGTNQLEQYQKMLKSPHGIILVTGPTGSGKTTTLYATLNQLAQKKVNIVTVEDPVEKKLAGVNQVQVNLKADLTFVSALRSILRQDPDIIMIGEMRDEETASIGVRAAITGHLVFSTVHTNDASSSIIRLLDMGIPTYMVAASLTGVVAQRLVKTLCPYCKEKRVLTEKERFLIQDQSIEEVYEPVGCSHCNFTGYVSRKAIYEIIEMDTKAREMITKNASIHQLKEYQQKKGTSFLRDSVLEMVKAGETSVSEMEKIIYSID